MSEDKLYSILKEGSSTDIPWHEAAEQLIILKMASGGILPEEVEELEDALAGQEKTASSPEDQQRRLLEQIRLVRDIGEAKRSGLLSGIRSSVAGDISHATRIRRKRGERIGKSVGAGTGTAIGALLGKGKGRIPAAALGAALGYVGGKGVGEEVDRRRIKAKFRKKAEMSKQSHIDILAGIMSQKTREDLPSKSFAVPESKAKKIGVGGEIQGEAKGKYPIPDLSHAKNALARVSQHGTPAEREAVRSKVYAKFPGLEEGFEERHGESPTSKENVKKQEQGNIGKTAGLQQPELPRARDVIKGRGPEARKKRTELRDKLRSTCPATKVAAQFNLMSALMTEKTAKDEGTAVEPVVPVEAGPNPMEEFLQAQQEMNELEFFRQKAMEAEEAAAMEAERAEQAEAQLNAQTEQQQMEQQDTAMREEASTQQQQMAQQQAQMAQQDAVQARDESLQAQQSNIMLRQAITSYRQQLMDLLSQDPTQMVPPPMVPQGPGPEAMGGPQQPPPEEAAPQEGVPAEEAPPEQAPPDEAAPPPGPPPGGMPSPGGLPQGMPPGTPLPGPPAGGPAPKPKAPKPAGPPAA